MGVYTRSVPYGAGLLYCRDPEKLREAGFLDFGIQTRPAASLGSENVLQAQNTRRKKDGISENKEAVFLQQKRKNDRKHDPIFFDRGGTDNGSASWKPPVRVPE